MELTTAIESSDMEQLQACIKRCEEYEITDDDGEIEKAKRMLNILQTNDGNHYLYCANCHKMSFRTIRRPVVMSQSVFELLARTMYCDIIRCW